MRWVLALASRAAEPSTRLVRGLGAGVDVGAAALKPSVLLWGVVSGHLGDSVVDSSGAQPRGWRVRVSQMYRFSASFPYKLANSLLLNAKAELLLFP